MLRISLGVLGVAMLFLGVLLSVARQATPTFGLLALVVGQNGTFEIATMWPDGSNLRQLTQLQASSLNPSWSPDGRTIAFSSNAQGQFDIWQVSLKGVAQPIIAGDFIDTNPAWAPDGQWLVFNSSRSGNIDIFRYQFETGLIERLTNNPRGDFDPSLSPDGQWMVYVLETNESFNLARVPFKPEERRFYEPEVLTEFRVTGSPDWSPDGTQLLFHARYRIDRSMDLYTLTPGSDPERITFGSSDDQRGVWSQNGKDIVFDSNRGSNSALFRLAVGQSPERITPTNAFYTRADFGPAIDLDFSAASQMLGGASLLLATFLIGSLAKLRKRLRFG